MGQVTGMKPAPYLRLLGAGYHLKILLFLENERAHRVREGKNPKQTALSIEPHLGLQATI